MYWYHLYGLSELRLGGFSQLQKFLWIISPHAPDISVTNRSSVPPSSPDPLFCAEEAKINHGKIQAWIPFRGYMFNSLSRATRGPSPSVFSNSRGESDSPVI